MITSRKLSSRTQACCLTNYSVLRCKNEWGQNVSDGIYYQQFIGLNPSAFYFSKRTTTVQNHTNTAAESLAARRIFGLLPAEQASSLVRIWEEFEEGKTSEAKFARAMDRLEPLLQNASNDGGTWKEFNVPYNKVLEKKA